MVLGINTPTPRRDIPSMRNRTVVVVLPETGVPFSVPSPVVAAMTNDRVAVSVSPDTGSTAVAVISCGPTSSGLDGV